MYDREEWVGADGGVVRRDQHYEDQSHDIEAVEKLRRLPLRTGRLLDVGCGTGHFVATAQSLGFVAEGVELSRRRVEHGRQRGLTIHHGDLLELQLTDPYDAVLCIDVLSHVRAPMPFLRRVAEIMRSDGILMLETGNKADLAYPKDGSRLRDFWGVPGHLTFFGTRQLRRALDDAGFEVQTMTTLPVLDVMLGTTRLRGGGTFNVPKKALLYAPPLRRGLKHLYRRKLGGRTESSSVIVIARRR